MPQYRLAAEAEAAALQARADESAAEVVRDIQRSTNYVLCVVLFAAALFLAGIATKLTNMRFRTGILLLGVVVFAGTVIWIATFPVNVSV